MNVPKRNESYQKSDAALAGILDWVTVEDFCRQCPNIAERTIKWQLTSRNSNGLAPHVQVIGKTRYISITGYAKWLNRNFDSASQQRMGNGL